MEIQYKVILSSKRLYKEIVLASKSRSISVGTTVDCDVRLPQNVFFEGFLMTFCNDGDVWRVICGDGIYIASNEVNKLPQVLLNHGDEYRIKYKSSDTEFLVLRYLVDFDADIHSYDMCISLRGQERIIIGGVKGADIGIKSEFMKDGYALLSVKGNRVSISDAATNYGVYVNGVKITEETVLSNYDFFSLAYCSFFYKNGKIYTAKKNKLSINGLKIKDVSEQKDCLVYPQFGRNSRLITVLQKDPITVLAPPEKPQKPKDNLLLSLFPAIAMVAVTVMMRGVMGGSSYLLFSVCSMGLGVITSIMTFGFNRKQYRKDCEHRMETYQSYIERKRKEIQKERDIELEQLNEIYINHDVERKRVKEFSSQLFDRTLEDEDFTTVYLGTGIRKSVRPVDYKPQEKIELDDTLAELPVKLAEEFSVIRNAPITVTLRENSVVGVVGTVENSYSLLKNMVFDLAVRHYSTELRFYFVCNEENEEKLKWVRWLPHIKNPKLGMNDIVCDSASKNIIFEELFIQLSASVNDREQRLENYNIVFVFDDMGIREHPLFQHLQEAKTKGFTFVFFEREEGLLPLYCESIICLDSFGKKGTITETRNKWNCTEFYYQTISDEEAVKTALKLSPVYCEEISLEGGLAKKYSFYQMLHIFNAEELDLRSNWSSDAIYKTLGAPLGINAKNEIVVLDLHENAHGPHGLVAGTTGSGKSEILQSYILSMAIKYHPDDVGFVIIDFKGGGMANQFSDLPHLIGTITNIDGREIERSLKSIKAELQKRQRLFAEYNVNKIDSYIHKYKEGEASVALPHLIIVVDEFAELKADQPEFMKELISAARIGRSLGVHLILATQKPAGQVDDQIWSNSRFKLCLKVQDQEDSKEVLKSPLAAEIREPGRAYLQVGNNEIFMLFQSAYSGGSIFTDENVGIHEFKLTEVNTWGKREVIFEQKRHNTTTQLNSRTQLEAIVGYIRSYCEKNEVKKLPSICMPPLCDVIPYPEYRDNIARGYVDIGVYDDPDNQVQNSMLIDISTKNTFILGSSQYGKTNMLQSIIRAVLENMTSDEANIYILDFGSRILKNFETADHVGGVVCSNEDEKLKNLFKLINHEISNRKEVLATIGVSSYAAYREAGYADIPQIYLVIDNLTALMELYLEDDDTLLVFIREGAAVGITTIVANAQTGGISYKYLANFSNKIVLYCNDSSEYNTVFDHVTLQPKEVPGRCILEMEKRMLECQTYLAFAGEKEIERVERMQCMVEKVNEGNSGKKAKMIPYIPAILSEKSLEENYGARMEGYQIPIGLTYADTEPYYLNLSQMGAFGLCGKTGSGHRNFVEYVLRNLDKHAGEFPVEVCIYDDISRKYDNLKELSIVTTYTLDLEKITATVTAWHEELSTRYQNMLEDVPMEKQPMLLMIIQNNDAAKAISDDFTVLEQYNEILSRYRSLNVCFLFANYANMKVSYDAPEPLLKIREEQHLLFFDDLANLKVFDPDYEALKRYRKKVGMGDAYYIRDNEITKLKMVLNPCGN